MNPISKQLFVIFIPMKVMQPQSHSAMKKSAKHYYSIAYDWIRIKKVNNEV